MNSRFAFLSAVVLCVSAAVSAVAGTDYFVDANNGVDADAEGRGLSAEMPYLTITYALNKAKTSGDRVYVAEGTYQERNLTVSAGVGLIASGRRDYTTIDANASSEDNARCIANLAAKAYVKGFTIQNGWTTSNGGGVKADANAAIIDCAIRNCRGERGGGGNGGVWIRCYFSKDNVANWHASASGVYGPSFVANCVFDGAGCVCDVAGRQVVNCTFKNNVANAYVGTNGSGYWPVVYNSIIVYIQNAAALTNTVAHTIAENNSSVKGKDDKCLFSPAVTMSSPSIALDADFIPLQTSTNLVNRGTWSYYEEFFPADWKEIGEWEKCYGGGVRKTGDEIDIGAGEFTILNLPGLTIATEELGDGKRRLSVSQDLSSPRYASGFTFDGESVSFDANYRGWTWSKVITDAPDDHAFVPTYADENCYYVDGTNGDDENNTGVGRFNAFKTLQKAMASVAKGGTVFVMPGTYRYTENYAFDGSASNVVCITKQNVTLVGVRGAKRTIIEGNPATDASGVRCVNANQYGAVVRGFTLKNGGAASGGNGGGVLADGNAAVIDCEIRNCCGYRGGGGNGGVWIRCYFSNDNVANWAPAASGVYGPVFVANCVFDGAGCVCDVAGRKVVNCTFRLNGANAYVGTNDGSRWPLVYNSIVENIQGAAAFYNSVAYLYNGTESQIKDKDDACLFNPAVTRTSPLIALDADFAPLSTATQLVGCGNRTYYEESFPEAWREIGDWTKCYGGGERLVGDAIDIGAGAYSAETVRIQSLSKVLAVDGRVTVTEADAGVTTTDAGQVSIPAGASLTLEWEKPFVDAKSAKFVYSAELAAGAKLIFREFGEVFCEITASGIHSFESLYDHRFEIEAVGGAVLLSQLRNTSVLEIVDANGRLSVTGASLGANEVILGDSLTATFSRSEYVKPLLTGILVNGEFRSFSGTDADVDHSVTVVGSESVMIRVEAVYAATNHWYVDAVGGNDENDGFTPYRARRTLVEAMKLATSKGDVVHAAPGVYSNGIVRTTGSTFNRVEVSSNCGLVADEGPSATVIEGQWAEGEESGCGPDSIRCVYLKDGAWIQGFTVRNGGTASLSEYSECGGGIFQQASNCIAMDCIVENCRAVRGGGVSEGSYFRCLMRGNNSSNLGKDAYNGEVYCDCVFTSGSVYGQILKIVNCTFVDTTLQGNLGRSEVYNSYVYHDNGLCNYHHCVWRDKKSTSDSTFDDDCVQASGTAVAVDGETYRPLATATALVDKGRNDYYADNCPVAWPMATDVAGGQRVYNAAIDIGAGEHDWRPAYAQRLVGKRGEIVAASPGVVEGASGIALQGGESLTVKWTASRPGAQSFSATVTGEGVLTVLLDGVPLAATEGVYAFESKAGDVSRLEISFTGTGTAEILKFCSPRAGLVFYVK